MKNKFLALLLNLLVITGYAQETKTLQAVETNEKIKIDGILNEPAWTQAHTATGFVQYEPSNGAKASFPTKVKVLYDQTGIYFGFINNDPHPDSIRTDLTHRDQQSTNTDLDGILIDPFNKGLYGYGFMVTAAGVQLDLKATPNGEDYSLDAVWQSATHITDSGWTAEIKIPYSALRFPVADVQTWKINFFRFIARYLETDSWNFIDKTKPGFIVQSGELTGIHGIKPPLRLAFMPYFSTYLNNNDGIWSHSIRGGMDLKYGINESFTLDMMLIPDFGQVESDDKVLNLSPFETYYVEKRQFFTEGSELFNKGGIFYSRRIGAQPENYYQAYSKLKPNEIITNNPTQTQILNATKLTGRTPKGLGIGLLNAITLPSYAIAKDTITGSTRKIMTQDLTNYNVLVLDQSLNNDSYISVINTNLAEKGNKRLANVTALDYQIRLFNKKYTLKGTAAMSLRSGSEILDNPFGYANSIDFSKTSGNFRFGFKNELSSNQYDINDLGYMQRNNFLNSKIWISYNKYKPSLIFLNWSANLGYGLNLLYENHDFQAEYIHTHFNAQLKNLWNIGFFAFFQPRDEFDWYEPRVPGWFYRDPAVTFFGGNISTKYNAKIVLSLRAHQFLSTDPKKHGYSVGANTSFRFNEKFNFSYGLNFDKANRYGYVYNEGDSIYFGFRHQRTITNNFTLNYIFTNKQGLTMRLRHYWSIADYENQFYLLQNNGRLKPSDFQTNADINYNAFTIDLIYTWNFAPGSELNLMWKNQIYTYDNHLVYNFSQNLINTIEAPQMNSFSFKILYYLDWLYLKRHQPQA